LLAEYHGAEPKVLRPTALVKKERKEKQAQADAMAEAQIAEQQGKGQQALNEGGVPLQAVR
jgi:hypothetical protein